MLEQLLLAEQAHKQALFKLEDEKRNHGEFMKKSDEFTNLLEQERERSEQTTRPQNSQKTAVLRVAARRKSKQVRLALRGDASFSTKNKVELLAAT